MEPGAIPPVLGSLERSSFCLAFAASFALTNSSDEGSRGFLFGRDLKGLKGFLRKSVRAVRRWWR